MTLTSDARRLAGDLDVLLQCVHCGLCLPECPTYQLLRDENDSPRGRLYLMRAMAEGRTSLSGAAQLHLGRCLGCRACETVCPAGVDYGALLEQARADLRPADPAGARRTRLLLWLLTGAPSRATYAVARGLRGAGLARWPGSLFPGTVGAACRSLAATTSPARRDSAQATAARTHPAPATASGANDGGGTYVLLEGCVMRGLFGHVQAASRRALEGCGLREIPVSRPGCCGALHSHAGLPERARRLARLRIAAFEASGADWMVTDSAGCGAALKEYGAWLAGDRQWAERAAAFSGRVRDLTEVLPAADGEPDGPRTTRIAYDAPCHLQHGQGIDSEPIAALRSLEGLKVEPLTSSSSCCGSAGIQSLRDPELSGSILRPKIEEILEGQYDAVVTGNPGCIMHIRAGLREAGSDIPVLHPAELLAGSWRPEETRERAERYRA